MAASQAQALAPREDGRLVLHGGEGPPRSGRCRSSAPASRAAADQAQAAADQAVAELGQSRKTVERALPDGDAHKSVCRQMQV